MEFKICKKCLLPNTKPDLLFNKEGVCSACYRFENRKNIDWEKRERQFLEVINEIKEFDSWNCVIPVSGGKDSTYQALLAREYGLKPLLVSSTTCDLSNYGYNNIENLKHLGFDHIQFSPRKDVRAKLNRFGLEQVGDISWPEHLAMFTIPITVAVKFKIPLVIWGENSQDEYGAGDENAAENKLLTRQWLEEFGGLNGMRLSDIPQLLDIPKSHLYPYLYPTYEEIESIGLKSIFLGSFFDWNGLNNAILAQAYGMNTYGKKIEGSIVDYENLDNHQNGIHDYFKYLKFGFGRVTDILSTLIRRGTISRKIAKELLIKNERKCYPSSHLGKTLEEILLPLKINKVEFDKICDLHTNPLIFKSIDGNTYEKYDDGTPILVDEFINLYK